MTLCIHLLLVFSVNTINIKKSRRPAKLYCRGKGGGGLGSYGSGGLLLFQY